MRSKRVPALIVLALVAVLVASPWSAEAARLITGRQIKDGSLTSSDIKDGTLTAKDFKAGQLPAGTQGAKGDQGAPGLDATAGTLRTWSVSSDGSATGSVTLESTDTVPGLTRIEVVDFGIDGDLGDCAFMSMLSLSAGSSVLLSMIPNGATPTVTPLLIPAGPARRLKLQLNCMTMDSSSMLPAGVPVPAFAAHVTFLTTAVSTANAVAFS